MLDRQYIFFPQRQIVETPADAALEYEDVYFEADDGVRLHGWFVSGETQRTLLWFHGNAGNVGHRVENLMMMHNLVGASMFIIDYRGYGRSEGEPTEAGLYLDAEAALRHLTTERGISPERGVILFGRSLGSAVAVELATRHSFLGVVLESPLTSIDAFVRQAYPALSGIAEVDVEAHSSFDSITKIGRIHCPVFILHGDYDEIVPYSMGRELYDAANEPKSFYRIRGAGHNDTYIVGGERYFDALKSFVDTPG
jgi:fermentation-respiration switch protein FrsA (DUF1100 family)